MTGSLTLLTDYIGCIMCHQDEYEIASRGCEAIPWRNKQSEKMKVWTLMTESRLNWVIVEKHVIKCKLLLYWISLKRWYSSTLLLAVQTIFFPTNKSNIKKYLRPILQTYLTQENFFCKVVQDSFRFLMKEATVLLKWYVSLHLYF